MPGEARMGDDGEAMRVASGEKKRMEGDGGREDARWLRRGLARGCERRRVGL